MEEIVPKTKPHLCHGSRKSHFRISMELTGVARPTHQ